MGQDNSKNSECPVRKFKSYDHTATRKVTTCSAADLSSLPKERCRRSMRENRMTRSAEKLQDEMSLDNVSYLSTPNENDIDRSMSSSPNPRRRRKSSANHFMSRRDRVLVTNSWKRQKKSGPDHVGTKIFMNLLTANPAIKEAFDFEKIPDGRLKYEPHFRTHSIVYTRTFDYIVKNLEYPDKLESHFIALGRRHVGFQKRGFALEFWDIFTECMTAAVSEPNKPATKEAWHTLVTIIIQFMRKGFDEDNAKQR